jgi:hypothetical protein
VEILDLTADDLIEIIEIFEGDENEGSNKED